MIRSWQEPNRWGRGTTPPVVLSLAVLLLGAVVRATDPPALDSGVPFEVVVVDVRSDQSGIVSATLVNRTDHSVRDVRLLVRHEWLWNDEMSPGPEVLNPGRAVFHTVEGSIPAQGRKEFVYRPDPPLRGGASGSFRTKVEVIGFTEIGD
jgi:hypothetical protein